MIHQRLKKDSLNKQASGSNGSGSNKHVHSVHRALFYVKLLYTILLGIKNYQYRVQAPNKVQFSKLRLICINPQAIHKPLFSIVILHCC